MYLTQGGAKIPKEYVEVFGGGSTAQLTNFEALTFFDRSKADKVRVAHDKGQANQLAASASGAASAYWENASLDSTTSATAAPLPSPGWCYRVRLLAVNGARKA